MSDQVVKLTELELEKIKEINTRHQTVRAELAEIGMAEMTLKGRKQQVESFHSQTLTTERELAKELEEKYGKGSIDLNEGTFTPIE